MRLRIVKLAGVILACGLLSACGSTEYLITKNDGTVIQAYGKPKVDEKSGMVSYRDSEGRSMQMQREDVNQIIER